jgi:heme oxygenase (biliverdin-IX-beta and delta-forming)
MALEAQLRIEELDQAGYIRLLQHFLGWHLRLERRLDELATWRLLGLDPERRRRVPALLADLHVLAPGEVRVVLPMGAYFPQLDAPRLAGAVYVMEGSTLGGTVIHRMLQRTGVAAGATSYFSGYGRDTAARWRETCAALERYGGACADDVVDGARRTFSALACWLGDD